MTSPTDIALRRLEPGDGPVVATLFEQTPDAGQITFTTRFKIDAYTALTALHPHSWRAGYAPQHGPGRRYEYDRI